MLVQDVASAPALRGRAFDPPGGFAFYFIGALPYWGWHLGAMPSVPDEPTADDASAALKCLDALLTEFPFVDEESHAV